MRSNPPFAIPIYDSRVLRHLHQQQYQAHEYRKMSTNSFSTQDQASSWLFHPFSVKMGETAQRRRSLVFGNRISTRPQDLFERDRCISISRSSRDLGSRISTNAKTFSCRTDTQGESMVDSTFSIIEPLPSRCRPVNKNEYRPDLDGLRAIAILAVLAFHFGLGLEGGYVGVDIFFVLSGYLITRQIVSQLDRKSFSLAEFYGRRAKRLFPVAFVTMLATSSAAYFLLLPKDFLEFGQSLIAQSVFASNFYFSRETGYFDHGSIPKPLLHYWSLAVEEQFYFIYPLLLLIACRLNRIRLLLILSAITFTSLIASLCYTETSPQAAFFLLPTRAWELLIGGLVALSPFPGQRKLSRPLANSLSVIGLGSITVAMFTFDETTEFPGISASIPCIGTAILIGVHANSETFLRRTFSSRPLVFIGLISYSLYLWHWPVVVYSNVFIDFLGYEIPLVYQATTTLLLALLSYRLVEKPFRRTRTTNLRLLGACATMFAVLAAVGFSIHLTRGFPKRLASDALKLANGISDRVSDRAAKPGTSTFFEYLPMGLLNDDQSHLDVFLWGDSHANCLYDAFFALCERANLKGGAAIQNATLPVIDYSFHHNPQRVEQSTEYNLGVLQMIRTHTPKIVILAARWNGYLENPKFDTTKVRSAVIEIASVLAQEVPQVVFITQVPEPGFDVPRTLAYRSWFSANSAIQRRAPSDELHRPQYEITKELESLDGVNIIELGLGLLDPTGSSYQWTDDGGCLFIDDNHLSRRGINRLGPLITSTFDKFPVDLSPHDQSK